MSNQITTDAAEVFEDFRSLTVKEMKKAIKSGITKGSNLIRKTARQNLKTRIGKAATSRSRYGDTPSEAVRLTKIQEDKQGNFFRYLLITASRKSRSISFVLRWFESGTLPRRTRKGYNRGRMTATNFFSDALSSTQSSYNATVDAELTKKVQEINNKKMGK